MWGSPGIHNVGKKAKLRPDVTMMDTQQSSRVVSLLFYQGFQPRFSSTRPCKYAHAHTCTDMAAKACAEEESNSMYSKLGTSGAPVPSSWSQVPEVRSRHWHVTYGIISCHALWVTFGKNHAVRTKALGATSSSASPIIHDPSAIPTG